MSNYFGLFLLFSVLVTGLMITTAFAQEPPVNATDGNSTSIEIEENLQVDDISSETNSTSSETVETEDDMAETEDDMAETEDDMAETEDDFSDVVPSPLKQIKEGIAPENIVCKEGLELVFKLNGQPACIKTTSVQKLIAWGWTQ
jgi:hypothetical protein